MVTLTITSAPQGQTVELNYSKPTGQNAMPLRVLSGNEAADFLRQSVTNNTAPALSSASVNGTTLTISLTGGWTGARCRRRTPSR